jgi:hypothetical protein
MLLGLVCRIGCWQYRGVGLLHTVPCFEAQTARATVLPLHRPALCVFQFMYRLCLAYYLIWKLFSQRKLVSSLSSKAALNEDLLTDFADLVYVFAILVTAGFQVSRPQHLHIIESELESSSI